MDGLRTGVVAAALLALSVPAATGADDVEGFLSGQSRACVACDLAGRDLDAEQPPRVLRRLNRPDELRAWLVTDTSTFIVPSAGARVVLSHGVRHRARLPPRSSGQGRQPCMRLQAVSNEV